MCKVSCVGIICADVLVYPVNRLPEAGKLGLIDGLELQLGGCAANAAVALAKLGVNTRIAAKVGRDELGAMLAKVMTEAGVHTQALRVTRDVQSSASVVTIGSDGERTVLHCLGANAIFSPRDVDLDLIQPGDIVFVAGTFLMPQFEGAALAEFLAQAKAKGATCCLDTAWDSTGRWLARIDGIFPHLEWFMPSLDEAREMAKRDDPVAMAECFQQLGVPKVVIKLGCQGCLVAVKDEKPFIVPALKGAAVVDTSGAGDAFCAGFIAGLTKGYCPAECARLGNCVAALCISAVGTTTGISGWAAAKALFDRES